ncbi:MAG: ankyrin repeat domain-containing protein [Deltaproteobacteria bacterium]|nr:ankyrin repeat domain-containing protein [Deltaproteobacteria bacterium]
MVTHKKNGFVVLGILLLLIISGCAPAIFDAVRVGDVDKAENLLANEPKQINATDDRGATPLHSASIRGYKEVVVLLIAKGADVNAIDIDGNTPLHSVTMAVGGFYRKDHKEIAELLIANGADINVKNNKGRRTPLHFAAVANNKEMVELFLANGANVYAKDQWGKTPLYWARSKGYEDVVELLREYRRK